MTLTASATPEWLSAWSAENQALSALLFETTPELLARAEQATRRRLDVERQDKETQQAAARQQAVAAAALQARLDRIELEYSNEPV